MLKNFNKYLIAAPKKLKLEITFLHQNDAYIAPVERFSIKKGKFIHFADHRQVTSKSKFKNCISVCSKAYRR